MAERERLLERPVNFRSGDKELFGIFHPGKSGSKEVAIVFINSGLQSRRGPHLLYVTAARFLSELGFACLRVDVSGLGDSEGEIVRENIHFDFQDHRDTLSAVDYLIKQEGIASIVLLGLCSGARNAVKAAAKDARVDSVILWSLPIVSISPNMPGAERNPKGWMSRVGARFYLKKWLRKGFSLSGWRQYFASGGSWGALCKMLKNVMLYGFAGKKCWVREKHLEFFTAFESILESRRSMMIAYGGRDILIKTEFEERFKELANGKLAPCSYYVIPKGDHTFSSHLAKRQILETTAAWLRRQYGGKVNGAGNVEGKNKAMMVSEHIT